MNATIVLKTFERLVLKCNECGTEWEVREGWEHRHICPNDPFGEEIK